MKVLNAHRNWIGAIVVGVLLVGAAVGMAQRENESNGTPPTGEVAAGAQDARQLSSVFRFVSEKSLPSIVSIRTTGKATKLTGDSEAPLDENSPFGEMFKDNPQFREFFRRMPQQQMPTPHGMGSGFIIDSSGIIMTNNHVVQDAEEVMVRLQDGREFVGTDIKTDPRTDVAILRIDAGSELPALKLGDSEEMQIGDWVLAVGSPFGLDGTVTAGIIGAKGRSQGITQRDDFLQTDAAINPGNSGGPLLNLDGDVVGINTAISSRSGGYDGIGFAIPVNMAKWVSNQLREKGEVQRAYLGVGIQPVTLQLAERLNAKAGEGAIVTQVAPGSPAEEAKLEAGDVIVSLDGKKVVSPKILQDIVERLELGKSYKLEIVRNREPLQLEIAAKAMPQEYALENFENPKSESETVPSEDSFEEVGIEISALSAELAEKLGVKEGSGVAITSVSEGSLAEGAGLQPSMIVEKVDSTFVKSPEDFREAMKSASLEKGIAVLVRVPNQGSQFIVIQKK